MHAETQLLNNAWTKKRKLKTGQTLVEYGLIMSMLSIIMVTTLVLMKNEVSNNFSRTVSALQGAMGK